VSNKNAGGFRRFFFGRVSEPCFFDENAQVINPDARLVSLSSRSSSMPGQALSGFLRSTSSARTELTCVVRRDRGTPAGKILSFASPKESNLRKGDPNSAARRAAQNVETVAGRKSTRLAKIVRGLREYRAPASTAFAESPSHFSNTLAREHRNAKARSALIALSLTSIASKHNAQTLPRTSQCTSPCQISSASSPL
jgi:hypothetical protein